MTELPITLLVRTRTVSELNRREHWSSRSRRARAQRRAVAEQLMRAGLFAPSCKVRQLVTAVRMTRIAPRRLDSDNLQGSMKHVRDEIAYWLNGGDDSDGCGISWEPVEQRRGVPREYAVEVVLA